MCEVVTIFCGSGENIPYILVIVTGFLALIWALIMFFSTIRFIPRPSTDPTKNPLGFKKTILWLELIDKKEELFNILGKPGDKEGIETRILVNKANSLDNIFIFIYSAYNASIFYFVYKLTGSTYSAFFIFGLVLSVVMLVTDFLENKEIHKLTKVTDTDKFNGYCIFCIQLWARLKWGAIAVASLMLSVFFFYYFINQFKLSWELVWFLIPILFLATGVSMFLSISISTLRNHAERAADYVLGTAWLLSWVFANWLLWIKPLILE